MGAKWWDMTRRTLIAALGLFGLGLGLSCLRGAELADKPSPALTFSPEEQAFEIKLARLVSTKGNAAMLEALQAEHARNPRAWTKTWIAKYSLHAKAFGVKPMIDTDTAWKWVKEAMAEGGVHAHTVYGSGLIDGTIPGRGQDKNADQAEGARLVLLAAEAGDNNSMITASHCYFFGQGVPQDRPQALVWARKAAVMTFTMGLQSLADYYAGGVYVVPADKALAARLYYEVALYANELRPAPLRKLAAQGVKEAEKFERLIKLEFMRQGYRFTNAEVKATFAWLEEQGAHDPEVLVALGVARLNRRYHTYDLKAARRDFEQAAAKGSAEGRYYLAYTRLKGMGVPKEEKSALEEIRQMAEAGLPKAAGLMGWAHYWGSYESVGVAKNPELTRRYSLQAAKAGDWFAVLNVGHCYKHGIGGPVSNEIAYFYYGLAAKNGSVDGREELERLRPFLKD